MPKQSLSGNAARAAILNGVDQVVDPVKVTLGPRGRNVLIDRPFQPLATRDGATVAKEISNLPDPFENMGAVYAREVADAAVTEAGDGTTTASVILQAIMHGGSKLIDAGAEPLQIHDGILAAAAACAVTIKAMAIPATPELVKQVAIISTHGDVELGTMIAEASCKVGSSGVVEMIDSRIPESSIEYLQGFYFERGWSKPNSDNHVFVNDPSGQACILENPYILISERPIVGFNHQLAGDHLFNVLNLCVKARRPLLILADDLIGDAYNGLTANVARGNVAGCFVKLPGYGDAKAAAVKDLAIAVGAKRVHTLSSTREDDLLSTFTLDDLGNCKRAVIHPNRTVLLEGAAHQETLNKRIKQLITQSQESGNPYEKQALDHRIARLTGGVAVLRVGAHSEPAMIEKKARAEDAIHACKGALEQGVVPGGGVALLRAAQSENYTIGSINDFQKGCNLLLDAIREPLKQIARNGGYDADDVFSFVADGRFKELGVRPTKAVGFNAADGTYGDMYQLGIIDPVKVVLTALEKAASVGALLLTTEVLITDLPEPKQLLPLPQGAMRA